VLKVLPIREEWDCTRCEKPTLAAPLREVCTGRGLKPMLAVDIFRLFDGKVVKPWVVKQEGVPTELTKSGNRVFTAI
jgi:hypothetical protein